MKTQIRVKLKPSKKLGLEGVTFVQMVGCIIVQYFAAEKKHFHPPNPTSCTTSFHPCKELRFLFGVQTARYEQEIGRHQAIKYGMAGV